MISRVVFVFVIVFVLLAVQASPASLTRCMWHNDRCSSVRQPRCLGRSGFEACDHPDACERHRDVHACLKRRRHYTATTPDPAP